LLDERRRFQPYGRRVGKRDAGETCLSEMEWRIACQGRLFEVETGISSASHPGGGGYGKARELSIMQVV